MPYRRRALAILLCALVCAPAGFAWTWLPGGTTQSQDLIHRERPDVSRAHRRDAHRSSLAFDTNFDGRSDVEELYENGVLVRRESDRNFDDQIDLVQDFDPATRQIVRSITDVNDDGVADLLVLFQNGKPVFSKWRAAIARVALRDSASLRSAWRTVGQPLAPLVDPFSADLTYKPLRVDARSEDAYWLPVPLGLPEAGTRTVSLVESVPAPAHDWRVPNPARFAASDLRGPPSPLPSLS